MNPIEHLIWVLEDARGRTLKLLDDVYRDELQWRPCESCNSIGSMAIHVAKVEDILGANALGLEGTLWTGQGWHARLHLDGEDWGWGFDKIDPDIQPSPQEVKEYLVAVRARLLPALQELPPDRLVEVVKGGRVSRSIAQTMHFIAGEELQHVGQMDYVRGMKRSSGQ